jgi:hypothetical protein
MAHVGCYWQVDVFNSSSRTQHLTLTLIMYMVRHYVRIWFTDGICTTQLTPLPTSGHALYIHTSVINVMPVSGFGRLLGTFQSFSVRKTCGCHWFFPTCRLVTRLSATTLGKNATNIVKCIDAEHLYSKIISVGFDTPTYISIDYLLYARHTCTLLLSVNNKLLNLIHSNRHCNNILKLNFCHV